MKKKKRLPKAAKTEISPWEQYLTYVLIADEKDWEKIRNTAKTIKARR